MLVHSSKFQNIGLSLTKIILLAKLTWEIMLIMTDSNLFYYFKHLIHQLDISFFKNFCIISYLWLKKEKNC
jgi:hypothetical protein